MIEGDFTGKCVRIEIGQDGKGRPVIRGDMQIVGGAHDGARVPYDGKLDEKGIKWTKRDMLALGWTGKDVRTLVDDVRKANKVVPFQVAIARWNKDDGTVKEWSSVRSIGGGAQPLATLDSKAINDVNDWFAKAGVDDSIPF